MHLRMAFASLQMRSDADDSSFLDDHAADDRINTCLAGRFGEPVG